MNKEEKKTITTHELKALRMNSWARMRDSLTREEIKKEAQIGIAKQVYLEAQRKRRDENLHNFLRENALNEIYYYKENIRIYFKVRKKSNKIYKLEVIEFDPKWIKEDPDIEEKLNNRYVGYLDMGNLCMERWKWETCAHVIYNLFTFYGFENRELEKKALCELSKICEFRLEIAEILFRFTDLEK